jgi:hypothetical protein
MKTAGTTRNAAFATTATIAPKSRAPSAAAATASANTSTADIASPFRFYGCLAEFQESRASLSLPTVPGPVADLIPIRASSAANITPNGSNPAGLPKPFKIKQRLRSTKQPDLGDRPLRKAGEQPRGHSVRPLESITYLGSSLRIPENLIHAGQFFPSCKGHAWHYGGLPSPFVRRLGPLRFSRVRLWDFLKQHNEIATQPR